MSMPSESHGFHDVRSDGMGGVREAAGASLTAFNHPITTLRRPGAAICATIGA